MLYWRITSVGNCWSVWKASVKNAGYGGAITPAKAHLYNFIGKLAPTLAKSLRLSLD